MNINKSELEAVAVKPNQYPPEGVAEIAFAGRSNVGKSSLLNLLTGRKKLARVSGSPGKTRTINFYRVNDAFRIVDLPGYGYAKVSKSVSEGWGEMMERYLEQRGKPAKGDPAGGYPPCTFETGCGNVSVSASFRTRWNRCSYQSR